jgi:hypothetical protein
MTARRATLAEMLGGNAGAIEKRGRLKPGMAAHIVVFDLDNFGCATPAQQRAPRPARRRPPPGGGVLRHPPHDRQWAGHAGDGRVYTGTSSGEVLRSGAA